MSAQNSSIQTLMSLGLTLLQAKVYRALAKSGQSTIATTSKLSGVARPDLYRTLSKLQQLGLVSKIIETPFQFKAIPLDEGLALLLEKKTEEHDKLKTETRHLIRSFEGKKLEQQQPIKSEFVLIPQSKTVVERIRKAIEDAQKSIDVVLSWKRYSLGIAHIYTESTAKAWDRKVNWRFIVEKPEEISSAEHLIQLSRKSPFCQMRFIPSHPKTVLGIYDKKEIFIILDPTTELPGSPALWSNNQSLISIAQDYFDILWLTSSEKTEL